MNPPDPLSDPDAPLIARIGLGDQSAVRQFVTERLPRVLALSLRLLRDGAEAEDVAQEAFLRVWRQAPRWQAGQARFDTWLHTVTLNLCRDRLRRRRHAPAGEMPDPPDPGPRADAALEVAARGQAVTAAIAAVPERQREAILLVHYQDLTNIAAAQALGISVDALESLLARGRRALKQHFAQKEGWGHD